MLHRPAGLETETGFPSLKIPIEAHGTVSPPGPDKRVGKRLHRLRHPFYDSGFVNLKREQKVQFNARLWQRGLQPGDQFGMTQFPSSLLNRTI